MLLAEQARVKSAYFADHHDSIEKLIWNAIIEGEMFIEVYKHRVDMEELREFGYEIRESSYSPDLCRIMWD